MTASWSVSGLPFNARTVVGTSVHDGFRDGLLSPSRVNGDDRAADVDQLEKFGNRRDFIGFLVRGHLPEAQAEVARPEADRMQCAQTLALVVAPPQRLSIDHKHRLINAGRTQDKLACSDNLVIAPDNPVIAYSPDLYSQMQIEGSRNAYWQTTDPIKPDDKSKGALKLLPGPLLKSMPTFQGSATASDTLRPIKLKPRPPLSTMATDGGSVGVHFEYLPSPPPFRSEMLKRDK